MVLLIAHDPTPRGLRGDPSGTFVACPRPRTRSLGRARTEAGFTMVEIIVVMVIVAILLAIAVPTFRSGKTTAMQKGTIAAAQSYRDAVNAFALDHSSRAPVVGTTDWPTANAKAGPRQPNLTSAAALYYMKTGAPDPVTSGTTGFAAGAVAGSAPPAAAVGTACAASTGSPCGAISYAVNNVVHWQMAVWIRKGGTWKVKCTLTDGAGGDTC